MSYIAPIHRPSSIREAVRITLWPGEEVLVTAKANRLEISRANANGIVLVGSAVVCGTITQLQRLKPRDTQIELLFVATDRFQYFTAKWDPTIRQLVTEQIIEDVAEPHMRDTLSQNRCLVDPKGLHMAMHMWEGVMNVMKLGFRKGHHFSIEKWEQVRLSELFIKSSTFVQAETGHPTIAFLYQTNLDKEDAVLAVYRLMSDDRDTQVSKFGTKDRQLTVLIPDPYARMLIPVPIPENNKRYNKRHNTGSAPAQLGGLLVVGETLLLYVDTLTTSQVTQTLNEPKVWVAWVEYDATRYILADDYGHLYLLTVDTEDVMVVGISLFRLGRTSRASSLVYMGNDILFIASHHGDSQLFSVDLGNQQIQLIQTIPNIAPILDFAIMDMGHPGNEDVNHAFSSGQARIVAGCGVHHNGSLRSVRSSVGLEAVGVLGDFDNIRGLFTIKSHMATKVDTLIVSFLTESRVFVFRANGEIEEVFDASGLVLDQPTLAAVSLLNGQILQVTPTAALLLDPENGVTMSSWSAPTGKTIVSASCNKKWALLSVGGTTVVSLDLLNNLAATEQSLSGNPGSSADQVSCIHVSQDFPNIGVVGLFAGSVSLVDLKTLDSVQSTTIKREDDSVSIPRDVALVQLHSPQLSGATLFIAMQDGQVVSLTVDQASNSFTSKNSVTLGSREAALHVLPQPDSTTQSHVFATTEHSSLIYGSEGRIIYSAAAAEDVTYIAPFDSEAFPDAVIIATEKSLMVSTIDPERRTHVNPLHMGETVRRVAYSPTLRAFGLGTIKKELIGDEEIVTSWFQLVDEIVLGHVGKSFALEGPSSQCAGNPGSGGTEIVESVIRAELTDSAGEPAERFIVGTSFLIGGGNPINGIPGGRILILGIDSDTNPYLLAAQELQGSCRSLAMSDGKIIAGLSKTVVAYEYTEATTTKGSLRKLATYRPSTVPVSLDVSETRIGVADLTQSLALLEYVPPLAGKAARFVEKSRHFQFVWATAVASLGPEAWLEADAHGNLLVLETNPDAPTEHDVRQMRVTSEFHLGEQVNQIKTLQIDEESAIISPKAFLGTVEGSLYVYATINPKYQNLLLPFQERLAEAVQFLGQGHEGGASFNSWRGFRNAKRTEEAPFRFVDGELLERFLDLDEIRQEAVVEGLGPSVEDMRGIVEELRRMH